MAPSKRLMILACLSALAVAACGGDEGGSAITTIPEVAESVATTTASPPSSASSTETTTTTTTAAVDSAASGQVEVVFDDGRAWSFEGSCSYTPDNTGPAAALWNIDAQAADGSTFIAITAFPFDPAKTTPVLIGNIVDAEGNVFVLIESEDVSDGSNLILNLGIHDGIKTVDDPIDLTATAICGL